MKQAAPTLSLTCSHLAQAETFWHPCHVFGAAVVAYFTAGFQGWRFTHNLTPEGGVLAPVQSLKSRQHRFLMPLFHRLLFSLSARFLVRAFHAGIQVRQKSKQRAPARRSPLASLASRVSDHGVLRAHEGPVKRMDIGLHAGQNSENEVPSCPSYIQRHAQVKASK